MHYILQSHNQTLNIESFGSQIMSWQLDSKAIFYTSDNPKRCGMPLMFPYCGPLKNGIFNISNLPMGQHGFGRSVEWDLSEKREDSITFQLLSKNLSQDLQATFPFEFEAQFTLQLLPTGIQVSLTTKNLGSSKMPVCPGFHPYFLVKQSLKDQLIIDSENFIFNTKNMPWDTGLEAQFYTNPKNFVVSLPEFGKLNFVDLSYLTTNGNKKELPCDLLTVWAGEVADFVCIEPMSKRFDSINQNPIWVEPGQEYCLKYEIERV
jgi:galactose mutarotase-like enzyme